MKEFKFNSFSKESCLNAETWMVGEIVPLHTRVGLMDYVDRYDLGWLAISTDQHSHAYTLDSGSAHWNLVNERLIADRSDITYATPVVQKKNLDDVYAMVDLNGPDSIARIGTLRELIPIMHGPDIWASKFC